MNDYRTATEATRLEDKTWLETHIWHAKRMHMENMWGYRLASSRLVLSNPFILTVCIQATHPTEKAYRPSHRASVYGSILHDASYESILELAGPEEKLKRILTLCCDPQGAGPGAAR